MRSNKVFVFIATQSGEVSFTKSLMCCDEAQRLYDSMDVGGTITAVELARDGLTIARKSARPVVEDEPEEPEVFEPEPLVLVIPPEVTAEIVARLPPPKACRSCERQMTRADLDQHGRLCIDCAAVYA
ncbi:MAG: hypothetical protein EOO77_28105 [Oxalobacteraceae bacterium]|nr:MAG: hypothetical protein EOO77_28105 [Oxalobacteraceae bacterium]